MATKKTKQTKPTYNQLIRERKKDHEDIIAKAGEIMALKMQIKGLQDSERSNRSIIDSLKYLESKDHRLINDLKNEVMDLKITVKTILTYNFKFSDAISEKMNNNEDYCTSKLSHYPCP